jgi:SPP1 family predicted phage head-tail adaptor
MDFKRTKTSKYNKQITIEFLDNDLETSTTGEQIKTYSETIDVWANIRTLSGNEKINAQQVQSMISHEVTIRYWSGVAGVKANDRIKFGSRYFDIESARNVDEANIEIRIICNETND